MGEDKKSNLPNYIEQLVYLYNCGIKSSTGEYPHYLFFEREPVLPVDLILRNSKSDDLISLTQARSNASEKIEKAQKLATIGYISR